MEITFDNVMEKVVLSRTKSRKQKQIALRVFIKENSKTKLEEEIATIEKLKAINKSYSEKDLAEKSA